MAAPIPQIDVRGVPPGKPRPRIRTRIITILVLVAIISVLFAFLTNYSGFTNWERIDTNLTIFGAVIVNIVVLTTVFYLILRNLFKLVYERKKPFSGVKLKTKLIFAFVALSLPSIAFHLFASGITAVLLENFSQGEFSQVLGSSQVVMREFEAQEEALLQRRANEIGAYLPATREGFSRGDWLGGYRPQFEGGIFVYDDSNRLIAQWMSNPSIASVWKLPSPQRLEAAERQHWSERSDKRHVRRQLNPLTRGKGQLEVFEVLPPELSTALYTLTAEQRHSRFLSRDLAALVLSFLIVMTLLIIFAATWIAFYLARGFVTPIERLDDATHRVSEGELGYEVEIGSLGPLEADFAGLVASFNTMSRQLKEQNVQLLNTTEDLRNSHHELGERNRLVELLLENIDAGIISLSDQGNVTAINRTAKRLMQPRLDAWQGRHYSVVLGREIVPMLEDMLGNLREEPTRLLTRNLNLPANRRTVIIEVTLLALENKEGHSEGTVLLLKDVSAMQRNQRALAWGEVARRVAHEIKNPLTPIQTSAERIRRRYLDKLDGEGEVLDRCTETIINQVTSLKKMVNEFSQFAKLPESKPVPGDMNEVIQEVSHFYENGLPDNVRLDLTLDKDLPSIPIDYEQMKRAFTNLIDNAAAALGNGGTISIRTVFDRRSQTINVDVMDDGSGVPEDVRSRMFEPYASTKEGGTGLGLTIVNQIVSDHNGFIRYSDRKPTGTVFTMEFHAQ